MLVPGFLSTAPSFEVELIAIKELPMRALSFLEKVAFTVRPGDALVN